MPENEIFDKFLLSIVQSLFQPKILVKFENFDFKDFGTGVYTEILLSCSLPNDGFWWSSESVIKLNNVT